MKNFLFLLFMATASLLSECQSQGQVIISPSIDQSIAQIQQAVNNKDFGAISGYLSKDYQYQEMKRPMSINVLKQVINQFPQIDSIVIKNTNQENDMFLVDVDIHTKANSTSKTIVLNQDNQIQRADIAELAMKGHGSSSRDNSGAASKAVKGEALFNSMPFYQSEGQMIVEATINGKNGNFIIDTGAPDMLMLNSNFQSYTTTDLERTPLGVSGAMSDAGAVIIESFEWNGLVYSDFKAVTGDLDHLGRLLNVDDFAGAIGYDLLKDFIVEFDYQENRLNLWKNPDQLKKKYDIQSDQIIPFSMAFHLPVIKAKLGDKALRFGLDSGAQTGMIEPKMKTDIEGKYKVIGVEKLAGADTIRRDVLKIALDEIMIKGRPYTMDFILASMFTGDHEVTMVDGLIGYDFLSSRKTAINFPDNELYIID